MNKPWLADCLLSDNTAIALIENQFPQLRPVRLNQLGQGWDNTAYRVNDEWIFRFPRRQVAVPLLMHEMKCLPLLNEYPLSLTIPNPQFFGAGTVDFPYPFMGYPEIKGNTACTSLLTESERYQNAAILGKFLRQLHDIDTNKFEAMGATKTERLVTPNYIEEILIKKTISDIKQLNQHGLFTSKLNLPSMPSTSLLNQQPKLCLTHGDLYIRHLLLNSQKQVTAIIDWGDMEIGNPVIDLGLAHSFLPRSAHHVFRQAYGQIDAACWELAKWRALYSISGFAVYAIDINDDNLLNEAKYSLVEICH